MDIQLALAGGFYLLVAIAFICYAFAWISDNL